MYLDNTEKANVYRIFKICGLSAKGSASLVNHLHKIERHHGAKLVVDTCKQMFMSILKNYVEYRICTKGKVIRKFMIKHPGNRIFRGHRSQILQLANRGIRGLRGALRILKVPGRWEKTNPDARDYKNFIETISSSNISESLSDEVVRMLVSDTLTPEDFYLAETASRKSQFIDQYPLGSKRSPIKQFKSKMRDDITPVEHIDAVLEHAPNLMRDHYDLLSRVFIYAKPKARECEDVVGVITPLTKDRGLKVRFVANPFMILQVGLSRLKRACKGYLETLPQQCVFDQSKGERVVKEWLKGNQAVTSLDLTSASDLIPADPQFQLLEFLFPDLHRDISLFKAVSRGIYLLKHHDGNTTKVRWSVGQPLGTEPSFFSFTLFLLLLLRACGGDETNFRIIGDDLVMHAQLAEKLVGYFEKLGIKLNAAKSVFNGSIAEFAGRTITRRGNLFVYKASKLNIKGDTFGYIRQYGWAGRKLLPKKLRRSLVITALLPIFYGKPGFKFRQIPDHVINSLTEKKFKSLNTSVGFGPESKLLLNWRAKFLAEIETLDDPQSSVLRAKYHSSWYLDIFKTPHNCEEEYGLGTVNTLRGAGLWTVKCFDVVSFLNLALARKTFNELIQDDKRVSSHEALMVDISERLTPDPCYRTVNDENEANHARQEKNYLSFVWRIWKKIRKHF